MSSQSSLLGSSGGKRTGEKLVPTADGHFKGISVPKLPASMEKGQREVKPVKRDDAFQWLLKVLTDDVPGPGWPK